MSKNGDFDTLYNHMIGTGSGRFPDTGGVRNMAGSDVESWETLEEGHRHVSDRFGHDSECASFMALGPHEGLENDKKRWQTNPLADLNK